MLQQTFTQWLKLIIHSDIHHLKPQVGVAWLKILPHYIKIILMLIATSLISILFVKDGISMGNFNTTLINNTISYIISVVAGYQPVT